MKHFKDLFSILCLLFITSAFVACDDDNDEYATDDETILSVPQDDLIFTYEGEAKTINVTASENTFVASVTTGDETWAHVSTANNSVKIVVDENVDQQERSTTLTVKLNDARSRIRVKQDAAPAPEAKPKTFTVPTFTGTDKTFVYKLMDGNTQVGEICREYLCSSGNIDKQAIVVYPMVGEYAYTEAPSPQYPYEVEPWEQNITSLVDFESKWKDMIPAHTPIPTPVATQKPDIYNKVGVYEGAGYTQKGIYRPVTECRMKINEAPAFCPVCQRALERLINFYTEK